ncbi:hypothetical protein M422DRAFT_181682, partial [Sphaerobolus stellatus SS14]
LPKGRSRKLTPKYIGPYKILTEVILNMTYKLELPVELFLLSVHIPNDGRKFPGHAMGQVTGLGGSPSELPVQCIMSHSGAEENSWFEVYWFSGDKSWLPYTTVSSTTAFNI